MNLSSLVFPKKKFKLATTVLTHKNTILKTFQQKTFRRIRAKYGIKDDEFMILFLGRLVGVKGVDKLIMAMPHILTKIPNAKLVIVGVGDLQEYLTNLDSITIRLDRICQILL